MEIIVVQSERDTAYPTGGMLRFKLKGSDEWIDGYAEEFSTDFIEGEWLKTVVSRYKWNEVSCYQHRRFGTNFK